MTEQEKMLAGKIYDPSDGELATMRTYAHKMCTRYNKLDEDDPARKELLEMLLNNPNGVYLQGPIFFDYGEFTSFGKNCYANFNFTVLDCAPVTIGDNVFFGPNVTIAAPIHPLPFYPSFSSPPHLLLHVPFISQYSDLLYFTN